MTLTEQHVSSRPEPGSGRTRRGWRHHARANRAAAGRMSWGLADQAVSSMTNFAVGLYVARSLGSVEFGIFSLAWVTFSVVLNMSRGLATDPLVVRFSGVDERSWRTAVGLASGTALSVGVGVGALCVLAGGLIGGTLGSAFIALGIVLPWLTLQDSWRYAFFAAGRGGRAVANDLVWAVALIPAMAIAAQHGSVFSLILAWGLSAAVAACFGCLQTRQWPHWARGFAWLRQHRDLGPRYMVENVSSSAATMLRMYGLGAIAGLADVGAVRGADLLLAPLVALLMGICLVAVPEAARVLQRRPRRLLGFCLTLGCGQAIAALTWGLSLVLLLPDAVGRWVLPSLWDSASALIVPVALAATGIGMANGASTGLRALGSSRRSLRAQLISAGCLVTLGLAGAALGGALGSAWGAALATAISAAVSWAQLLAGLHELDAGEPDIPARVVNEEEVRVDGEDTMATRPRLTIGLPVYNGENYLSESLDSLLRQSFTDFELIISDNASTDRTEEICRRYAAIDPRIRYLKQPVNIGAAPNHNAVVAAAGGELFKWAAHDDLYGPELLARCVAGLDEHPDVVLCHANMAIIDGAGELVERYDYTLATDSADPAERFQSLLFTDGGDDYYGVIRTDVLRAVVPQEGYHNGGRKLVAELALHGRFHQVPELLYFRRDHPGRGDRNPSIRAVCANLDPRRARHSTLRLLAAYVHGLVLAVRRAPLTRADRRRCYGVFFRWLINRTLHKPVRLSDRMIPVPAGSGTAYDHGVALGREEAR